MCKVWHGGQKCDVTRHDGRTDRQPVEVFIVTCDLTVAIKAKAKSSIFDLLLVGCVSVFVCVSAGTCMHVRLCVFFVCVCLRTCV